MRKRQYKGNTLRDWVWANPGRWFVVEEANQAVDWNINSTARVLLQMVDRYDEMETSGRGVYRWNAPEAVTPETPSGAPAGDLQPVQRPVGRPATKGPPRAVRREPRLAAGAKVAYTVVTAQPNGTLLVADSSNALFTIKPLEI